MALVDTVLGVLGTAVVVVIVEDSDEAVLTVDVKVEGVIFVDAVLVAVVIVEGLEYVETGMEDFVEDTGLILVEKYVIDELGGRLTAVGRMVDVVGFVG